MIASYIQIRSQNAGVEYNIQIQRRKLDFANTHSDLQQTRMSIWRGHKWIIYEQYKFKL